MSKSKKKLLSLVTGGAGFVGSHVVDKLIKLNHDVIVVDDYSTGKRENQNKEAIYLTMDISKNGNVESLNKAHNFNGFIFHCAAKARIQPSFTEPRLYFNSNVVGTFNVLELARKQPIKNFIYLSSSSIYGHTGLPLNTPIKEKQPKNPCSPYSFQKLMGEQLVQSYYKLYKLPCVICRLFNVYGKRQLTTGAYATVIGIFMRQKRQGKKLTIVKPGTQRRDFTHVSDTVRGLVKAAKFSNKCAMIFNIGTGKNYSVIDIANIIHRDHWLIDERKGEYPYTLADITLAGKFLKYTPKVDTIEKGIALC